MAIAIASASEIAAKFSRVTPGRTQDYADGVRNPKSDWKTETMAAEPRYKEAVIAAANAGRFGKGVAKAGTDKQMRKSIDIGTQRWGPGVAAAADDYQLGFEPYRNVIASLTLPPRYPTGDPRNIARVAAIAKALNDKKIAA